MERFGDAMDSGNSGPSDDDDRRLFEPFVDQELVDMIIRIKHDDSEVTDLELIWISNMEERAWRRLGCILGQNTNVEELGLVECDLDMAWICTGLRKNQCIKKLWLDHTSLQDAEWMRSLAPFLRSNPSLKEITLVGCNIGPAGINILSTALLNRAEDSIEKIDLRHNNLDGMDLDYFVSALKICKSLVEVRLSHTGIGRGACALLAKLLENQESILEIWRLYGNPINNDCAFIFAESLAKNTKLKTLELGESITTMGWLAILNLVCNVSSINDVMESNHTLHDLGWGFNRHASKALERDDFNLLKQALSLNRTSNKISIVRQKILWGHVRGNLNIGDSPLEAGVMPKILAWIGDDSREANAELIQYHHPLLPRPEIDAARIGSIYRILRSMPDLAAAGM